MERICCFTPVCFMGTLDVIFFTVVLLLENLLFMLTVALTRVVSWASAGPSHSRTL